MESWYTINNASEIDSPALVVYPDRVKHNIQRALEIIGDVSRLRPHVKTHKCQEVARLQIEAGITKFKCATIAEAEMLGLSKAKDVLLAYQPNGPKTSRLINLIKAYPGTEFSCLIDNLDNAKALSKEALKYGLLIPVYIDLNVGMNRTGIAIEKAAELYQLAHLLTGIIPVGLHAYDGHVHQSDLQVRTTIANGIYDLVKQLQADIRKFNLPEPKIIIGGSPTFPIYAAKPDVECSPGTFVYWDQGYQQAFPEQGFLTAALILARVISLPGDTKVCIDVGHKSVAAENTLDKRIMFLNAPDLKVISQSEEHLVADAGDNHPYKPGDILYGLPYHICPTIALYERVLVVENEYVTRGWLNIARDRKITI